MGFWDRFGAAAEQVSNIAPGGAFGLAWDIARNTDLDNQAAEQGASFFSKVGPAADGYLKWTGYGLASRALGHTPSVADASVPYHYVARGASTFQQATGFSAGAPGLTSLAGLNFDTITDLDSWRQAWNRSDEISPGQASVINDRTADALGIKGEYEGIGFTEADREKREEFFHGTWAGRATSGTVDVAANFLLDPLAAAGKGFKAANAALSTVKDVDRADALATAASRSRSDFTGSKRVNRAAGQMRDMFEQTDNLTASEMMQLPQFRDVPDSAPLAYFFEEANRITDAGRRYQAKADYFGVALGDAGSIQRVSGDLTTAQAYKRFLDTPETTRAGELFVAGDGGAAEFSFLNSDTNITEVEGLSETLTGHIDRLERLLENQNTTLQTGYKLGQRELTEMRLGGVRQTLWMDNPTSRPIRFLVGQVGSRVPGNINVADVSRGHDDLAHTLKNATWIPAEKRREYMTSFLSADSREARAAVLWRVENSMFKHAGEEFGYNRGQMEDLLSNAAKVRGTWRAGLTSRLYSSADPKLVVGGVDPDGWATVYNRPFLQSQVEDAVPLTDPRMLEKGLRSETNRRVLGMMAESGSQRAQLARAGLQVADEVLPKLNVMLGSVMRGWKFAALLRPAYIARIQVDTQLRLIAAMGALESASRVVSPAARYARTTLTGNLSTAKLEALEQGSARRMLSKDRKVSPLASKRLSDSGIDASVMNPAQDTAEADKAARLLSGNVSLDQFMNDETGRRLQNMRASGNFTRIGGENQEWRGAYLRSVNQQIRNSPTAKAMLTNSDDEAILAMLRTDPKMRAEWNNFKDQFEDPEQWVATVRGHVNAQVPDQGLAARISERELTDADIEEYFPNKNAGRPDVHGESMVPMAVTPLGAEYTKFRNWWFKFASDVPETVMGRHPLYDYSFRKHMQRMVETHDGDILDPKTISNYRTMASRKARKDVANTLFDLSHSSNMSSSLSLFSPFFSAWEDTMKKWGRLFYDDPSRAMRFQQAYYAPNDAGLIRDEDGNRVDSSGQAYDSKGKKVDKVGEEGIVMPAPFLKWAGASELKFRKDNFNLVFQGSTPWLPGVGPLVTVPANTVTLKVFPEEADHPVLKWILPYGPSNDSMARQAMPAWWRQVGNAFGTNQDHANMANRIYQAELTKLQKGERTTEPTPGEVARKTRMHFIMRAVISSSSPVTATPNPEFQLYIDEARRIDREYAEKYKGGIDGEGRDSAERFYDEYPEYYAMSVSLSANNTGVQATAKADNAALKYKNLIAKNPEYGWMIVGPENEQGFESAIYEAQLGRSVAPGSNTKYRGKTDIVDAADKIQSSRGWIEYQKGITQINIMLEERGLHSYQQRGAEDLAAMKAGWIQAVRDENPAWGRDFDVQDSGKARELLRVARSAMSDKPELANRADMKALAFYMDARTQIREILSQSQYKDISHPANEQLKVVWDAYVQSLVQDNIGFEQMFNRVLERDDIGQSLDSDDTAAKLAGRT